MLNSVRTLNLFRASPPIDGYQLKTERITTFVYILLLILSCLVLLVYTATQNVTQTITVQKPSLEVYQTLHEQEQEKLSCPCTTITSEYRDFISIAPVFHPICASDFVQDKWINYKAPDNIPINTYDFRRLASLTFHAVASFCSLANSTVSNALITFNATKMISIKLLSKNLFHEKIQQVVDAFIPLTNKRFSHNLDLIRTIVQANGIASGYDTNSVNFFQGSYPTFDIVAFDLVYGTCVCSASPKCTDNATIRSFNGTNFNTVFTIPGFYIGCYIDEATRKSTLKCYFNQSCVDTFKSYLNFTESSEIKALDPNAITNYNITSSVDDLIEKLMIEQWLLNDSFGNYYEKCQPSSCSYKLVRKTPLIVIVTTLIGLLGGLSKVLRFIVPIPIRFIRRPKQPSESQSNSHKSNKTNIVQRLKNIIQNFNLFRPEELLESDANPHQLKTELISTRLFICLLLISLLILLIYTSQVQVTHIVTVNTPSIDVYSSIYTKYAETLVCPCTNVAIAQEEFISLTPTYHQVCNSDFVDLRWIVGIYNAGYKFDYIYNRDFRSRGYSTFSALISICSLAKTSVTSALIVFDSTTFISKNILPRNMFISGVNASINSYITTLAYTFSRSFRIARDLTQGNGLVSTTLSSISFRLVGNSQMSTNVYDGTVTTRYKTYDNGSNAGLCSCHDFATCSEEQYVHTPDNSKTRIYRVPGLVIGCYAFEAMLQSNLLCFFNQTCVDGVRAAIYFSDNFTTTALIPSKLIHFTLTSNIQSMVDKTMVENWISSISYVNYYNQCQPMYCQYTYNQKNDIIYIVTTLVALVGGLTTGLQLIVPRVVHWFRKFLATRQQRRIEAAIA